MLRSTLILTLCLSLIACGQPSNDTASSEAAEAAEGTPLATATFNDADGKAIGSADLAASDEGLIMTVTLDGLETGERALHLHTTGLCDAPDFKSAGGHLNPSGVTHGKNSETGPHLGDFPNIVVAEDGKASVSHDILGDADTLSKQIFDEDGTAVMLHEGPDDYATDPAGAAGPRIACGVLKQAS
jgi:Cu-Zn family superoxide dismutase